MENVKLVSNVQVMNELDNIKSEVFDFLYAAVNRGMIVEREGYYEYTSEDEREDAEHAENIITHIDDLRNSVLKNEYEQVIRARLVAQAESIPFENCIDCCVDKLRELDSWIELELEDYDYYDDGDFREGYIAAMNVVMKQISKLAKDDDIWS